MGCVCLWGKIKKGGREAEKEGDIREIGKKCLERKRKCNILNIYLINLIIVQGLQPICRQHQTTQ